MMTLDSADGKTGVDKRGVVVCLSFTLNLITASAERVGDFAGGGTSVSHASILDDKGDAA